LWGVVGWRCGGDRAWLSPTDAVEALGVGTGYGLGNINLGVVERVGVRELLLGFEGRDLGEHEGFKLIA